jgi:flagellar hook-length control protein FliK
MQGTAIAGLAFAMGNIEAADTAAGPGLRMSSRQQSETKSTLFTEILNHKGTVLGDQTEAGLHTGEETAGNTDETDDGYGADSDVCGLLMQMLLMNNSSSGQQVNGENAGASELGAANSTVGNLAAATVTLQPNIKQPDAEPMEQTELPVLADAAVETADGLQGMSSDFREKLMDAIARTSQLEGGNPVQDGTATEKTVAAQSVLAADAQGQDQAAQTGAGSAADVLKNSFGQAVSAAAQNSGLRNGQTDTVRDLKAQLKETGAAASDTSAKGIETADKAVLADVQAAVGDQPDDGKGELLSDDDKGSAMGRDESDAAILNRTFTNTSSYGGVDAAETTAAVEKAFNRFADDVKSLQAGVNEIKIVLEPESLGTMVISVVRTENGISAKIKADDKQVCEAISGQIQKLVSSLESRGIHVEDMDVSYSQADQSNGFNQQNFSDGRDESARERSILQDAGSGGNDYTETAEVPGESADADKLLEYRL